MTEEARTKAADAGLKVYTFNDVVEAGRGASDVTLREPTPDSVYMICYTSGTTGNPKGARCTHEGFVANIFFYEAAGIPWSSEDVIISYLPYGHAYE